MWGSTLGAKLARRFWCARVWAMGRVQEVPSASPLGLGGVDRARALGLHAGLYPTALHPLRRCP